MNEVIDLDFDHILLAPFSNRKRNRDNNDDDVDNALDTVSGNKRSITNSTSTGSSDVVCTVIKP